MEEVEILISEQLDELEKKTLELVSEYAVEDIKAVFSELRGTAEKKLNKLIVAERYGYYND